MPNFNPNSHLTQIKGKGGMSDYLEVKWRLVWFRDVFPQGQIDTKVVELTPDRAVFHATVTAIKDGEIVGKASGTGSETPRDFNDYIEKSETKAVGRALAMLGFGTQFAPEMEEGERIVDSPVKRTPPTAAPPTKPPAPATKDKPITNQQKGQLFALAGEIAEANGWPREWVKDDLYAHFSIQSTTQLTTAQAYRTIRALYAVKDRGATFLDALTTET